MDAGLKQLISICDQLFSKLLRSKKSAVARAAFVRAQRATQSALRAAKDSWMWRLGCGPDVRTALTFCGAMKIRKIESPNQHCQLSGKVTSDPQVVANAFAESFKKNFQRALDLFSFQVSGCRGGSAAGRAPELRQLQITQPEVHTCCNRQRSELLPGQMGCRPCC
jgi:hypothetical protein